MSEIIIFLILLITGGAILIKREHPFSPEETAKAYYDLFIHEELQHKEALCLTELTAGEIIERIRQYDQKTIQEQFVVTGMAIEDDKIEEVIEARKEVFKRLKGKAELIAIEEDVAKVRLISTYYKDDEIYAKIDKEIELALYKLGEEAHKEEKLALFVETSLNGLVKYYHEVKIEAREKSVVLEFVKSGSYWIPKDIDYMGTIIFDLAMGYSK